MIPQLYRSIFIRLVIAASQICEITRNTEKIRTYSSSRPSKVIKLGANRKRIYNFPSVISSCGLSRNTVFEILTHKARKLLVFPTAPLFEAPLRRNPLEFQDETFVTKTIGMELLGTTDGQTELR